MAVKAIMMFIPSKLNGVTPKKLIKMLSKVVTKVWAICCNNAIHPSSLFFAIIISLSSGMVNKKTAPTHIPKGHHKCDDLSLANLPLSPNH